MTARTITGTLPTYPRSTVRFRQRSIFLTASATYLSGEYSATCDSTGAFSIAVPVPDSGTVAYLIELPDGTAVGVNLGAGLATTLEALLAGAFAAGTATDLLAVLIDAHALIKASTTVLGHVKVDGTTITAVDGVISSAGGGGGAPSGAAGGVLGGTYPNPSFASDMATQAELDTAQALDLKIAANLSDLNNAATARTSLGLGTAAIVNTGTSAANVPTITQADARYAPIAINGTVTSVALTVPGVLFSVAGSPVTASGTLALSLLTQTANTVLAGPASGGAATPTMRALVAADIPAISLTTGVSGVLPSANGGTGVNNAGTLTNATNTTITGGGTLALAGFTLTVPATGTAALLGTANVFTAAQTVNGANLGIAITGAASGGTPSIVASSPAQVASATAGTPLQITASPAIAGSSNAGAAAGGSITYTAGAAARNTSGNANGGDHIFVPGAGIGTGTAGNVVIGAFIKMQSGGTFGLISGVQATNGLWLSNAASAGQVVVKTDGGSNDYIGVGSGSYLAFSSSTGGYQTIDTGIRRNAAAVVEVNNGTSGQWGSLKAGVRDAGTTTITDGLTLGHQSTGTPAAGLGTGIQLNINSSTTADQNAARLTAEWVVATHASRTARATLNVYDTASREVLRGQASGSAPMIGFLGAAAVVRQTLSAAASDPATTQTLANDLRTALINLGLAA